MDLLSLDLVQLREQRSRLEATKQWKNEQGESLFSLFVTRAKYAEAYYLLTLSHANALYVSRQEHNSILHVLCNSDEAKVGDNNKSQCLQLFMEVVSIVGKQIMDQRNKAGETCLHRAVQNRYPISFLEKLTDFCDTALIEAESKNGDETALMICEKNNHYPEAAALLLRKCHAGLVQQGGRVTSGPSEIFVTGLFDVYRREFYGKRTFVFVAPKGLAVVLALPTLEGAYQAVVYHDAGKVERCDFHQDRMKLYGGSGGSGGGGEESETNLLVRLLNADVYGGNDWRLTDSVTSAQLLELDVRLGFSNRLRVGLIYGAAGQRTEEAMLENTGATVSDRFLSFCTTVLSGEWYENEDEFFGFTGGCDVSERALLASWRGFEIVFHVAPFLTAEQTRSKVGNCSVLIYYGVEEPEECVFRGQVNSVALCVSGKDDTLKSVFYRQGLGMTPIFPAASAPSVSSIRNALFANIVNGQHASVGAKSYLKMRSAQFTSAMDEVKVSSSRVLLSSSSSPPPPPPPSLPPLATVLGGASAMLEMRNYVDLGLKADTVYDAKGRQNRFLVLRQDGLYVLANDNSTEALRTLLYSDTLLESTERVEGCTLFVNNDEFECKSAAEAKLWAFYIDRNRPEDDSKEGEGATVVSMTILSGYLYKRKRGRKGLAKKRWCLTGPTGMIYSDKPGGTVLGTVAYDTMRIEETTTTPRSDEDSQLLTTDYEFSTVPNNPPASQWRAVLAKRCNNPTIELTPLVAAAIKELLQDILRRGLKEVGLFRVSGDQDQVAFLVGSIVFDPEFPCDDFGEESIHVVTGTLKKLLRMLQEPLLPFALFDQFVAAGASQSSSSSSSLATVIQLLPLDQIGPGIRRTTLFLLLRVLSTVMREPSNKMTSENLAIVFAPALLRCQSDSPVESLMHMEATTWVVRFLIRHCICCQLSIGSGTWSHRYVDEASDADDAETALGGKPCSNTTVVLGRRSRAPVTVAKPDRALKLSEEDERPLKLSQEAPEEHAPAAPSSALRSAGARKPLPEVPVGEEEEDE